MGAVEGIVTARDVTKLRQHDGKFYGGHISITKSLARSLLNRMGYVKRKCSTAQLGNAQFQNLVNSRKCF